MDLLFHSVKLRECLRLNREKLEAEIQSRDRDYLSWRDTKTAILLFNRNKDFTGVLAKIPHTVESHSCFKQATSLGDETTLRNQFRQPDDPNRELLLTIMAFNIPRI